MIRFVYMFILSLILASSALANSKPLVSKTYIDIENISTTPIQAMRFDGSPINLGANESAHELFRTRTYVYNFVDNKLVCQWYIHSAFTEVTHKLIYNPEYGRKYHTSPCTKIVTRIF